MTTTTLTPAQELAQLRADRRELQTKRAANPRNEDLGYALAYIDEKIDDAECFVCNGAQHPAGHHTFWSVTDARAEYRAESRRNSIPGYAEARYVDETRGR